MDSFDVPIFKKTCDLYKLLHSLRSVVQKQDRYTIWQRLENLNLDILGDILSATQTPKLEKLAILESTSSKINFLKVLIRLAKEIKTISPTKYVDLQTETDSIGRMLGGWIKSTKEIYGNRD